MGIGWDPSHDADRHFIEQDQQAAAEADFYKQHAALITQVAAGLAANPMRQYENVVELVEEAADIVHLIVARGCYE